MRTSSPDAYDDGSAESLMMSSERGGLMGMLNRIVSTVPGLLVIVASLAMACSGGSTGLPLRRFLPAGERRRRTDASSS